MRLTFLPILALMAPCAALAGDITPQAARHAVDTLIASMGSYTHPETGARVAAALKARRASYVRIDDRQKLAEALTATMQAEEHDLHLAVSVNTVTGNPAPDLTEAEELRLQQRLAYGLMAIRRLPGNIGYLKLRYFAREDEAAAMIDAAMLMLKDTDALIIDLRENTGGGGASEERLLGHMSHTLLPMAMVRWREADGTIETDQRHATRPASGPLYAEKPVYVLIAHRTFSAAEAFAYDLQAAKRAVLIGERTRGGANPANRPVPLGSGMSAFVPNGLVVHPTTGGNWEKSGVTPDVPTAPEAALTEAYSRALAVARPTVSTPKSEKERADAIANPRAALIADQAL